MGWGAPWGDPWGESSIPTSTSAASSLLLANPQLRLLLEVELGTYPYQLPAYRGVGPFMVSTDDIYVPALPRRRVRPYVQEVLEDDPVAYWRMDTLTAASQAGRLGPTITLVNTPSVRVDGLLADCGNKALQFAPASLEYGFAPANTAFDILAAQSFALEAWVKVFALPAPTARFTILHRQGGSAGSPYYRFGIDDAGRPDIFVRGTGGGENGINGAVNLVDGDKHHLVVERDAASDTLTIYVDGVLKGRITDPSIGDLATLNPLWVGVSGITTPTNGYINAIVDEVAFYRHILGPHRVEAHHQSGRYNQQFFWGRRLVDLPSLTLSGGDIYGGLPQLETIQARFRTLDPTSVIPDLNVWMTSQTIHGKRARAHLLDLDTGEVATDIFVGKVANVRQPDLHTTEVTFSASDLARLYDALPWLTVTPENFPDAPTFGDVVPLGVGAGRRVRCPIIRAQVGTDDDFLQLTAAANASTDLLTVSPAIDLNLFGDGDGPFYLATSGTMPGALDAITPYFLIVESATTVRLALSPGDALADVPLFVDITSNGTGTLVMTYGRAPQRDETTDAAVGIGNVGIVDVEVDGESTLPARQIIIPATDQDPGFTIRHRDYAPRGRNLTTLRFPVDMTGSEIRATVQRCYPDVDSSVIAEWKWLHGFQDDVGGLDAFPGVTLGPSDITTASLIRGPNPLGLGGVYLDGANGYLETPFVPALGALRAFTFETWILVQDDATLSGNFITGPGTDNTGALDAPAWACTYLPNVHAVQYSSRTGVNTINPTTMPANSVPVGRWVAIGGIILPNRVRLFVDRVLVADDNTATPIVYPENIGRGLIFGRIFTGTPPTRFRGGIGYTRLSSIAREPNDLARAYFFMMRNPIEAERTLMLEAGVKIDSASFDDASVKMAAIQGGRVRADGWLSAKRDVVVIRNEFIPFGDLSHGVSTFGRMTVNVSGPPLDDTVDEPVFELGGGRNNIAAFGGRERASTAERVMVLPVQYRIGDDGSFKQLVRRVFADGRTGDPLRLPWVDDGLSADIIGCRRAKHMRSWDEFIQITAGHDGRAVVGGNTARLKIPQLAIDRRYWPLRALRSPSDVTMGLVPYVEEDWTEYTPGIIPPETSPLYLKRLQLGPNPTLFVAKSGNVLTATVGTLIVDTLRPRSNGPTQQFSTIVGATEAWAALAETSADGDTSYIATVGGYAEFIAHLTTPTPTPARINALTVRVRARKTTVSTALLRPIIRDPANPVAQSGLLTIGGDTFGLTTSYADYTVRFGANPATGLAWKLSDANAALAGMQASGPDAIRVTQLSVDYEAQQDVPDRIGRVDIWVQGPSGSPLPAAPETDPPTTSGTSLTVTWQQTLAAGTYYVTARVYDRGRNLVATIGPQALVV